LSPADRFTDGPVCGDGQRAPVEKHRFIGRSRNTAYIVG
jgi:hypothetical protein